MNRTFVLSILAGALAACSGASDREVVVTRDQYGAAWPLAVNSARVVCSTDSAVLRVGTRRYALDDRGLERGLPPASEVARKVPVDPQRPEIGTWAADTEPLLGACEAHVAARD